MSTAPQQASAEATDLRAEYDALARSLEARESIDHVRAGAILGFLTFIAFGMSCKLAWDRWGPPVPGFVKVIPPGGPLFFILAFVATGVLGAFAAARILKAKRIMRDEDARFARYLELRKALRLDP